MRRTPKMNNFGQKYYHIFGIFDQKMAKNFHFSLPKLMSTLSRGRGRARAPHIQIIGPGRHRPQTPAPCA